MNGNLWTEPEIAHLTEIAGDFPPPQLVRKYNSWASLHGYPKRTIHAIRTKLNKMGLGTRAIGEWMTCRMASEILGCSSDVIAYWVRRGLLEGKRFSKRHRAPIYVSRLGLRNLARRKPELFNGYPYASLMRLLESEELVEELLNTKWSRSYGRSRPVIQVATGRYFPSIKEAARQMDLAKSTMWGALHYGWNAGGSKWRFARVD